MTSGEKRKVRVLIAVWGRKYYEYLSGYCLPSLLSPGNLPALARAHHVEIDFLTTEADFDRFKTTPVYARLRALAPVHCIPIDDLIAPGAYGVTLTAAFGRGMTRHGAAMTEIFFVFMNADFIVTDGSLAHLAGLIAKGHGSIMVPSYRAVEEALAPLLAKAVDPERGYNILPPREMVRLALASPHPTTLAKFVTQQGLVSVQPNQLYWRADEDTIVARYFLMFMLCIKPTRVVSHVNSYCDYSFVQHFGSLDELYAIGDSDDFFILELQSRSYERHFLQPGHNTPGYVAPTLMRWTTALHRKVSEFPIVFHAADLPPHLPHAMERARRFMDEMTAELSAPLDHIRHYHWVGGLQNWLHRSGALETGRIPEELNHPDNAAGLADATGDKAPLPTRRELFYTFLRRAKRILKAHPPTVPWWHYLWSNYRLFAQEITKRAKSAPILFVHDSCFETPTLHRLAPHGAIVLTSDSLLSKADREKPAIGEATFAALLIDPDNLLRTRETVRRLRRTYPQMKDMLICSPLYLHQSPQATMPVASVLWDIEGVLPHEADQIEFIFLRNRLHSIVHTAVERVAARVAFYPKAALFLAFLASPGLAVLSVAGTIFEALAGPFKTRDEASSFLMEVSFETTRANDRDQPTPGRADDVGLQPTSRTR